MFRLFLAGREKGAILCKFTGLLWGLLALFVSVFGPKPGEAGETASLECYNAIKNAARETGVSERLLLAVARTETGRSKDGVVEPWPWAINVKGKGAWLETEADLLEAALKQIVLGEHSFDVGCFQLNYRWHGDAFSSLDEMISPVENSLYAAHFLKTLFAEFGDWTEAVGAYHSRTEKYAKVYKAKFTQHYANGVGQNLTALPAGSERRKTKRNSYPLLRAAVSQARLGSLVPSAFE